MGAGPPEGMALVALWRSTRLRPETRQGGLTLHTKPDATLVVQHCIGRNNDNATDKFLLLVYESMSRESGTLEVHGGGGG